MFQLLKKTLFALLKFWKRQPKNWHVTVTKQSLKILFYRLTYPYNSVYATLLGATPTNIGLVNSIGTAAAGIVSVPGGWLIDRYSLKKIYLIGILSLMISGLFFASASSWLMIIPAVLAYYLGSTLSGTACIVVCADSLKDNERATGKGLCGTLSSIFGLTSPMIAAVLVRMFGGISIEGLKPLYYTTFAGYCLIFFIIYTRLEENSGVKTKKRFNFMADMKEIFTQRSSTLKRWVLFRSLRWFSRSMLGTAWMGLPFWLLFAKEMKGADELILGGMVSAATVAPLLLNISLGSLADRIGRKKVLYLLAPMFYISNLLLVFGPGSEFLILAGLLQGIFNISGYVSGALTAELVPIDCMGRWSGSLSLFESLISIPAPIIAGVVWEIIGPAYVFLIASVIDLCLTLPLLTTIPETLGQH